MSRLERLVGEGIHTYRQPRWTNLDAITHTLFDILQWTSYSAYEGDIYILTYKSKKAVESLCLD
jgi:hypothetical protein